MASAGETLVSNDLTAADYYADSYSHYGIHEEMLKDEVRTRTYMNAILRNGHLFKDKIVLDVGCGTGILSLFAAKAGAAHVYGVDMSAIADYAKKIVKDNGYNDRVTILHGKIEEIELPVDRVDIIISEWMGTCTNGSFWVLYGLDMLIVCILVNPGFLRRSRARCVRCGRPLSLDDCMYADSHEPVSFLCDVAGYFLLYESMLDTVLWARDKWLAENGMIFPDSCSLYFSAIEDGDYRNEKIDWWSNVYGFNMQCLGEVALLEPLVDIVEPQQVRIGMQFSFINAILYARHDDGFSGCVDVFKEIRWGFDLSSAPFLQICSQASLLKRFDLKTMVKEDATFSAEFSLRAIRNDFVHAFVAYFDVEFNDCHRPVGFSTGPRSRATHWKQTVFYLKETLCIDAGESIEGRIKCAPNPKNPRDLDIAIDYHLQGQHGSWNATQEYKLR